MPTSSDSSDDENNALLREAVDTTLFKDDMFKDSSKKVKEIEKEVLKSQRYLSNEDQQVDVRVSAEMQRRIGKKVSDIIESQIKFVDVKLKSENILSHTVEGGVKLFKDSEDYLTTDLPQETVLTKEQRKKIKKRKLQEETNDKVDKEERFTEAAVSPQQILSKLGIEHWKSRRKPKVFKYKESKKGKVLISLD